MIQSFRMRGFTLIELMVVITIIGLLASMVLSALSSTRVTARDSQRLSEARELMKALELYRTKNGSYPCSGPATSAGVVCGSGAPVADSSDYARLVRVNGGSYSALDTLLRSTLGLSIPGDTKGSALIYRVRNTGGGTPDSNSYTVLIGFENSTQGASSTSDGVSMYYCKITSGTADTISTINSVAFTTLPNCKITGV